MLLGSSNILEKINISLIEMILLFKIKVMQLHHINRSNSTNTAI